VQVLVRVLVSQVQLLVRVLMWTWVQLQKKIVWHLLAVAADVVAKEEEERAHSKAAPRPRGSPS
jgi:hypothetical protein